MHVPSDLSIKRSAAAHYRWALHVSDRSAATKPARRALADKFERFVDPDGLLDPVERAKRLRNFKSAYFRELALMSGAARRSKKAGKSTRALSHNGHGTFGGEPGAEL